MKKMWLNKSAPFWILISLSFITGTILRFYLISSQILIDDEWHGMNYVIDRSFQYVLMNHGWGGNSIPMDLYHWFLLNTYGWSELSLRAPALIAGVLSLILFPFFVAKICNSRSTIIFSFLLAISPVLVFYSRMCRPYSIVVLFGFLAFFSLLLWVKNGERKFVILYVGSAVLAVYFHLYASIAVLIPLGMVFILKALRIKHICGVELSPIVPGINAILGAGGAIFIFLSILILPAHIQNLWWLKVIGGDSMTIDTAVGYASLLTGTSNKMMIVVFLLLFFFGLFVSLKKQPMFGVLLIAMISAYLAVMILSRPVSIHASIVAVRYSIAVFPLVLIVAACGFDRILCYLQLPMKGSRAGSILIVLIPLAFLLNLFTLGPLLETYRRPNNFTNHSAFQSSYEPHTWVISRPYDIKPGYIMNLRSLPKFYFYLSTLKNAKAIIEYPMFLGDMLNLYYYYQHFHKKKIIAGYLSRWNVRSKTQEVVYAGYNIGQVTSRLRNSKKIKFKNMIDMENVKGIKNNSIQYIILHKDLISEMFPYLAKQKAHVHVGVKYLDKLYRNIFGAPFFEDQNIIVYKI